MTYVGAQGIDPWKLAFQNVFVHLNVEVAKRIAQQLWPTDIDWIDQFISVGVKGTVPWKQELKNTFVFLTRFKDPGQRRKHWKEDLLRAAHQTVDAICPNWRVDSKDRTTYNLIHKLAQRPTSPRQDWLCEKAYMWLKWLALQPPQNVPWSPVLAVQVAYELFLSGPSKIESFVRFLEKKNQPHINEFLQARQFIIARTMGLFLLQYVTCGATDTPEQCIQDHIICQTKLVKHTLSVCLLADSMNLGNVGHLSSGMSSAGLSASTVSADVQPM